MDFRSSLLLLFAALTLVGCRRRDPYLDAYLDMLNSEKRVLEDRVYQLEYDYDKALKELEASRAKQESDGQESPKSSSSKAGKEKKKTLQEIIPDDSQEPPKVEMPPGFNSPDGTQTSNPPKRRVSGTRPDNKVVLAAATTDAEKEDQKEEQKEAEPESAAAEGSAGNSAQRVEYIFLNPRLTGGQDFDQRPGDDGLSVLVEPRSKDGQFVPQPAKISVVVLDPAKKGAEARVARWDFDQETSAKLLRDAPLDRGIHLRMPWSKTPPQHERLQVYVRYWCDDGRKLDASRPITIRLPNRTPAAWTRRVAPPATAASGSPRTAPPSNASAETPPTVVIPTTASSPATTAPSSSASADSASGNNNVAAQPGRLWKPTR